MVKATVLEDVRKLSVHDYPLPSVKSSELLIRMELCGVCGTDIHIYEGRMNVPFPIILGHEFVGRIEAIGERAKALEVKGQPLVEEDLITVVPGTNAFCRTCFFCRFMPHKPNLCYNRRVMGVNISCRDPPHLKGGWAEHIHVDAEHWWVYKVPEEVPAEVAVLTEPMAVATRALEKAFSPGLPTFGEGYGIGDNVLIQGVGPIGLLTVAAARIAGAGKIIVIDTVDDRLRMAESLGADDLIGMKTFDSALKRVAEVRRLTGGLGADIVVECAGVPSAFSEGIAMTRRGGKFIEVGHYTDQGGIEVNPQTICSKDIDIHGSWAYPPTQFDTALQTLRRVMESLPVAKMVTHRFKVVEAEKAIQTIRSRTGIKMVIAP